VSNTAAAPGPELRRDPLSGEQVIIAPGRLRRLLATRRTRAARAESERVADCPFCPGNEHQTPAPVLELAEPGSLHPWTVRVVPNLHPAISTQRPAPSGADDLLRGRAATGVHEVIVETPLHNQELLGRGLASTLLLLEAVQRRLKALDARPATRHVAVFKNMGVEAGASLEHPHSQIVALDFVPADVRRRLQTARRYHRANGGCLVCALVERERQAASRVVFESDGFIAFAPYASNSAGETLLIPRAHAASFTEATPDARERLGRSLIDLLRRARQAFDDPAYNLVLQTATSRWQPDAALHWYWQLKPRLTRLAGFELGTGLQINPMAPEEAASLLRSATD
jgi:UDPglucose--hexose-1-phosphate uridylyltransferase